MPSPGLGHDVRALNLMLVSAIDTSWFLEHVGRGWEKENHQTPEEEKSKELALCDEGKR